MLTDSDLQALWLTVRLAAIVTLILLLVGTPIAWWLARTKAWWKGPIGAVVALPLVLPPSVLGFYLLLAMGPHGPVGQLTQALGIGPLPFTFWGLVIASVFYSLPFMVQPLQTAFEAVGDRPLEVAATLRASPLDAFFSVAVPLAAPGFLTASILTFAHTVGEFGVVLMIGGNLPGVTRVASVQILRPRRGAGVHAGAPSVGGHADLFVLGAAGLVRLASQSEERRLTWPGSMHVSGLTGRASPSMWISPCPVAASPRYSGIPAQAKPRCCVALLAWNGPRKGDSPSMVRSGRTQDVGCRPTSGPSATCSRKRACLPISRYWATCAMV